MTDFEVEELDWQKCPLIPAVIQDSRTRQVLMLGYMNRDALARTRETGLVTFFSRSRQTLWTKGETSGNHLRCVDIFPDCDNDTLLVLAIPAGPTCHRGTVACFDQETPGSHDFLASLSDTIDQRLCDGGEKSYVAGLAASGVERMAQKVGEEGVELAIAAVAGKRDDMRSESADLLFHTLVLLRSQGLSLDEVIGELEGRVR